MPPPLVLSRLWFSFGLFNHINAVSVSETTTQGSPNRVPISEDLGPKRASLVQIGGNRGLGDLPVWNDERHSVVIKP